MALTIYKKEMSPPCRAVFLTAKALELEIEYKDVTREELQSEEYLEKNPQHTVPTLEEEDFVLVDSNAILIYLVTKFGNEENIAQLYPEDAQTRGLINHRLFYNCGTMQSIIGQLARLFFSGETEIPEEISDKVKDSYSTLEKFLGDREWMVGDDTTLADLALIPSVTSLNIPIPVEEESFPKLLEWLGRVQELPYYEANVAGLDEFKAFYESVANAGEETEEAKEDE